jgi:NADP-dependent 3-hydroxy acid dehydrogenase YdfG
MSDAKTLVVVGAGPLLGMAVARRFGREGYRVGLISRTRARLDAYVQELQSAGVEATGTTADVLDRPQLASAIESIRKRYGRIDVLEYSPMIGNDILKPVLELNADNIMLSLGYYVFGAVAAVGCVVDQMIENGSGALLFTSGASALGPYPSHGNVSVSMGALRQYVRMLNVALEAKGVYAGSIIIAQPHEPAELADLYWDMVLKRDRVEEVHGNTELGESYERLAARGFGPGFPMGLTRELPQPRDAAERRVFLLGLYQARMGAHFHPDPAALIRKTDAQAERIGGVIDAPYYGVQL